MQTTPFRIDVNQDLSAQQASLSKSLGRTPTEDEVRMRHMTDPACSGCHRLIDPLGKPFLAFDRKGVWQATVGPPTAVGGIVGSTAYDGYDVYGPVTVAGYMWSVSRQGVPNWVTPIGDGAHWGNPVSAANGVAYSVDLRGFLAHLEATDAVPRGSFESLRAPIADVSRRPW